MIEAILGFGFLCLSSMVGWCISEVRSLRKELIEIIDREKKESILSQRRLDVVDATISDMTDIRLNSRSVVEKGSPSPKAHPKIMEMIHGK